MSSTAVLVRVHVPEVVVPSVDLAEARRLAGALEAGAEQMAASAWRLGGVSSAMSAALGWCGPASGAFVSTCTEQRAWFGNAWDALDSAGATCRQYADAVAPVVAQARQALARADQLGSELADLTAQVRQLDLRRAAAPTTGPGEVGVFTIEGDTAAEARRLQAWADRLAADAQAVHVAVRNVDDVVSRADARAAAAFDRIAAMTCAARTARAASLLAQARRSAEASEDGSLGSRVGGLLAGMRDDVTGPMSLVGGLVGLDGDVGRHWSALRSAVAHGVSHPVDLGKALVDWDDISQGAWGHWLGSVGPAAAASFLTGGGYAALKSAGTLELLSRGDALAAKVAELAELADHAEIARAIAANAGFSDSVLVRGGGLAIHEAAGGHTLVKHVGLTDEQLIARLRTDRRSFTASSFPDRPTAERVIEEVLDAHNGDIDLWLASPDVKMGDAMSITREVGRVVGKSVKLGKEAIHPTSARVWLVRDDSALGFHINSAYPLR